MTEDSTAAKAVTRAEGMSLWSQQSTAAPKSPAETEREIIRFRESSLAHHFLDGLKGLEIGAAAHNPFGLQTRNVGLTPELDPTDFEFYKASQIEMCGEWVSIDIPASADDIPVPDSSQDFVLSSHVWEHLANPLGALEEWCRVVRSDGYVLAIVPKRDAAVSDRGRPITPIEDHIRYYDLRITNSERKTDHGLPSEHYSVFSPGSLREVAAWYNAHHQDTKLMEVAFLETDDKVGNGHLILWQVLKTTSGKNTNGKGEG